MEETASAEASTSPTRTISVAAWSAAIRGVAQHGHGLLVEAVDEGPQLPDAPGEHDGGDHDGDGGRGGEPTAATSTATSAADMGAKPTRARPRPGPPASGPDARTGSRARPWPLGS